MDPTRQNILNNPNRVWSDDCSSDLLPWKVVVTGYPNLNNLVYPVASLEAADQLSHLKDKHERPEILKNAIICEMEVEEYGTNTAEGLHCFIKGPKAELATSLTMCFMDRCFLEYQRRERTS
jgi:hypothetical protein